MCVLDQGDNIGIKKNGNPQQISGGYSYLIAGNTHNQVGGSDGHVRLNGDVKKTK